MKKIHRSYKNIHVTKGQPEPLQKVRKMRQKSGGSNVGKYGNLPKKCFVGPAGGGPQGSYPVCEEKDDKIVKDKDRAIAALAYARHVPDPKGLREAVYKQFPSLRPAARKNACAAKRKT